jgi:hypothetical protein
LQAYLICNLGIPLEKQHSKEERHKRQEAKEPDVVLPSLGLLTIPATGQLKVRVLTITTRYIRRYQTAFAWLT